MRRTEPGSAERVLLRSLLAVMRQYVRAHGCLPRIDSDDSDLQQAWIELGRHLERNAKIERRKFRAELGRVA